MNAEAPTQEPIREDWVADIDNEKNVTLDDLKFIFAQAEKRLDDGIKNFDATTTKSISFITLSATLLTALTAYFFVNLDVKGAFDPKLCTVLCCCIYTAFVLYRFVSIILPKTYQPMGSYPQDLYKDVMFTDNLKPNNRSIFYLYLGELENYNCRIFQNAEANGQRLHVFNQSAILICSMPGFGLLIYGLLIILQI